MKKTLVLTSVLLLSILVIGCGKKDKVENQDTTVIEPTVIDKTCTGNKGTIKNRAEGGDIEVCAFNDNSFCFLEDLESGECEKGYIFFDEEPENDEDNSKNENCENMAQEIVCGEDGNTYFNRCYLNAAGVAEETELAHVENGECIYG